MNICDLANQVLISADPTEKTFQVECLNNLSQSDFGISDLQQPILDTPARPAKPDLVDPNQVPRRRLGSEEGRAAMLHAIAHIELNAIDLACDMIARFGTDQGIPDEKRLSLIHI